MMPTTSHTLTLGFIALARPTFDVALAEQVTATARAQLREAGFALCGTTELISDLDGAQRAIDSLQGHTLDVLVIFQATFADSTLAVQLAEQVGRPVLLWAVPEARTGERLRLNSLCGIQLAAHALAQRGRSYEFVYALPDDAAALAQVKAVAQAGYAQRRFLTARMGVVGEHPAGFDSCRLDAQALQKQLGVRVATLPLSALFSRATQADESAINTLHQQLAERVDGLATLAQQPLRGTLGVFAALRELAQEQQFDALAVRCWPEFFTELGCAACGAMALMNTAGLPCGCEADANGTLTQLMLQWVSGEPAFGTDLVEFNTAENSAVLWHCGQAPLSMADEQVAVQGGIHSNRKVPLVMEFALKPGRVTLARLSQSGRDGLRLVLGGGEMLRAPKSFSGTSGVIRFDQPSNQVLETMMREGLEHHVAIAYGDHLPALQALARMLGLPVMRVA